MVGISYLHLGEGENKQFPDWAPNSTCKLHFLFKSFHGLTAGHGLATSSRHMIACVCTCGLKPATSQGSRENSYMSILERSNLNRFQLVGVRPDQLGSFVAKEAELQPGSDSQCGPSHPNWTTFPQ